MYKIGSDRQESSLAAPSGLVLYSAKCRVGALTKESCNHLARAPQKAPGA
jgi:hypothetical protein